MITNDRFDSPPSPVRVLMSAHSFASDVPPETQAELMARYTERLAKEEARVVAPKAPAAKPALRQPLAKVWTKPSPKAPSRTTVASDKIRRLHAEGKFVVEMQEILGCPRGTVYRHMRTLGIEPLTAASVTRGDEFGQLTVERYLRSEPKKGRIYLCTCKCGKTTEAPVKSLRAGMRTTCGCALRILRKKTDAAVAQAVARDVEAGLSTSEVARRNKVSRSQVGRLVERTRCAPPSQERE